MVFDVSHRANVGFSTVRRLRIELKESKPVQHSDMCTGAERYDSQLHGIGVDHLDEMVKLPPENHCSTHKAMHRGLVEDHRQLRRRRLLQDTLPLHSDVDLGLTSVGVIGTQHPQ